MAYLDTPVGSLFPTNPQGRPLALRQVMSPRRLAELAAAAGANVAKPAPADQARHEGFYHGNPDERPLYPAMRFVHARMQLIQGEEEFWAERILVEERRNQEEAENLNRMQAQRAKRKFLSFLTGG